MIYIWSFETNLVFKVTYSSNLVVVCEEVVVGLLLTVQK